MAQSLEKIFLQKVAQMPQDEVELPPPAPRNKNNRGRGRKSNCELIIKSLQGCMVQQICRTYYGGGGINTSVQCVNLLSSTGATLTCMCVCFLWLELSWSDGTLLSFLVSVSAQTSCKLCRRASPVVDGSLSDKYSIWQLQKDKPLNAQQSLWCDLFMAFI